MCLPWFPPEAPVAFVRALHDRLYGDLVLAVTLADVLATATNVRLVASTMPRLLTVLRHRLADAVRQVPRALQGDPELAGKLPRRDPVLRGGDELERAQPLTERQLVFSMTVPLVTVNCLRQSRHPTGAAARPAPLETSTLSALGQCTPSGQRLRSK